MNAPARLEASKHYTDQVRRAATARWIQILGVLGIAHEFLRNKHGPCPGCGGRDRFRYDDREGRGTYYCNQGGAGDGFALIQHLTGCDFPTAVRMVGDLLGIERPERGDRIRAPGTTQEPRKDREHLEASQKEREAQEAQRRVVAQQRDARAAGRIHQLLSESQPLDLNVHVPARRYFEHRGLDRVVADPPALRFIPSLAYWAPGDGAPIHLGDYPALIAPVVTLEGEVVAMHRTYLRPDGSGKADVPNPRKLTTAIREGATRGAAIRLYPATERLALTEGIETALAVHLGIGWPVWSCISAGGLRALQIPAHVREVSIWADHDDNGTGQDAAEELADRLVSQPSKPAVRVVIPKKPGDWLDVLVQTQRSKK